MQQRVLVCGGRHFSDRWLLYAILDQANGANPIIEIVHGACPTGADNLANQWASERGVRVRSFPAKWKSFGPAAGPIRNRQMAADARPDIVIAFPGGAGTRDMVGVADKAGIPVVKIRDPKGAGP